MPKPTSDSTCREMDSSPANAINGWKAMGVLKHHTVFSVSFNSEVFHIKHLGEVLYLIQKTLVLVLCPFFKFEIDVLTRSFMKIVLRQSYT